MIEQFAERKNGIAATTLQAGRQRVGNVAATLSRRGRLKASAELCNEAVGVLIRLAWQADTDGCAANVDAVTGRLLIPAPWGDSGYQRYGLRSTEGRALRGYMLDLQSHQAAGAPIFTYDPTTRNWYLNVFDHNSTSALAYWERWAMTEKAYRERLR